MRAWKRKRSATSAPPAPQLPPPEELDRLVDEGMMIARSALRMAAKNHVILAALRSPDDFDEAALLTLMRADALALADEKDTEADRLVDIAGWAAKRQGRATYHDDYRRRDVGALTSRGLLNTEMASRLRALAKDDEVLRSVLDDAREAALDDMLQSRLLAAQPYRRDPDYLIERPERLESLERDLASLYRRQKARLGDRIE